jgi:hydrogenase maturation protease
LVSKNSGDILIAGIGNIFLGDDAFGCEVIKRLNESPSQQCVQKIDFGIRSLDLAYALSDEKFGLKILIDIIQGGKNAGTTYVVKPDDTWETVKNYQIPSMDSHSIDVVQVMRLAISMGANLDSIILIGCEPKTFNMCTSGTLSKPVTKAIPEVLGLVDRICAAYLD